ncbi:MAG: pirin family protein [Bacteroidales bacterium]
MYNKLIQNIQPLGFMWPVQNPFIFCVHHKDQYPSGNQHMGPAASLAGRYLGQDFTLKDGWRMYHGERIPGFPAHPHRGFETVTIVQEGFVDHSDSHGAAGRYGMGDVQWMTAGSGLQHCEMFPLIKQDAENPLELFQIWLNLPQRNKFADPHFKMLWNEQIPVVQHTDEKGKITEIKVYAGQLGSHQAPDPAPDSWAAEPANGVNIWTLKMQPGARYKLPATAMETNRSLYFYKGETISMAGIDIEANHAIELLADQEAIIECGEAYAYLLLLEAMPINEPVVQHGPFVMNTAQEIQQAFADYRRTQFGGWPWKDYDHVHPRMEGRFARYKDGREERPGNQ